MMNVKQTYDIWSDQYDTNTNKTRDLEAFSLRKTLEKYDFEECLEIGCGTGKNTEFLLKKAKNIVAVDFSTGMLAKAKEKILATNVRFIQADITGDWNFGDKRFDLVTFSLVLEHIENLNEILNKVSLVTKKNALVYIGELHPFKQYSGTKARFETGNGTQMVICFKHHISDFTLAAKQNGFEIIGLHEYFDDSERLSIPRILTLLLSKNEF